MRRRRVARRRLLSWIWLLLGSFSVAGLVLFMVQHRHQQQDPSQLNLVYVFFSLCCIVVLTLLIAEILSFFFCSDDHPLIKKFGSLFFLLTKRLVNPLSL